jgi:hypothetical protein
MQCILDLLYHTQELNQAIYDNHNILLNFALTGDFYIFYLNLRYRIGLL